MYREFDKRPLYAYKFASQFMPIYAFYTILFIHRGLSLTEIYILIALWSGFAIIFGLPSGVLADRWNRRNMLVLSVLLQGLCFLVWSFSHNFLMFALGFAFWALAESFSSGTEEGLIYDNLKHDGNTYDFANIYARAQLYANIGGIFGIVSAGIIVGFVGVDILSLISAVICLVAALLAMGIREVNLYSRQAEQAKEAQPSFSQTAKTAFSFLRRSKVGTASLLFLVLVINLGNYLDEFDALIINDFQLNLMWVSVILATRFVFVALGDILAPIVRKKVSSMAQVGFLCAISLASLSSFSFIWNIYALPLFGLAFSIMTISEIILMDMLQQDIKEEGRSTITSFYGMGQNVVMVFFSLAYALLTGLFSLQHVYILISAYGLIGCLLFHIASRKNHLD